MKKIPFDKLPPDIQDRIRREQPELFGPDYDAHAPKTDKAGPWQCQWVSLVVGAGAFFVVVCPGISPQDQTAGLIVLGVSAVASIGVLLKWID